MALSCANAALLLNVIHKVLHTNSHAATNARAYIYIFNIQLGAYVRVAYKVSDITGSIQIKACTDKTVRRKWVKWIRIICLYSKETGCLFKYTHS